MNARSQLFELSVEGRQIEEVVLSIFHTLLFHRTTGKFHYKREGTYSIGTVGILDKDCDFIDFTFVRCSSDELDIALKKEISAFKDGLRNSEGPLTGQITLEFYQRKKTRWPFPAECIPWEVWTIKLNVVTLTNEYERQICREKVGEILGEKIICITEAMNRNEYLPKMPNQSDLDCVFDTSYTDVQPYLYKVSHQTSGPPNASVASTMRKLFKETLAL